jgi:hypothetical protein
MSFSINSLSQVSGNINQMQANYGVRNNQGASPNVILQNSVGTSPNQPVMSTGFNSKKEFGAAVVVNTLDNLNSSTTNNSFNKSNNNTYQLTKDVVGSYLNVIA